MFRISFDVPILNRLISTMDRYLTRGRDVVYINDNDAPLEWRCPRHDLHTRPRKHPRAVNEPQSPDVNAQRSPVFAPDNLVIIQNAALEFMHTKTPASLANVLELAGRFLLAEADAPGDDKASDLSKAGRKMARGMLAAAGELRPLASLADAGPVIKKLGESITSAFGVAMQAALVELLTVEPSPNPDNSRGATHASVSIAQ